MSIKITRLIKPSATSPTWQSIPTLFITQGSTLSLVQYLNNPAAVAITAYALHAGSTLPTGVTLNTVSGLITAASNAVVGVTSGLSFDATFAQGTISSSVTSLVISALAVGPVSMTVTQVPYTGTSSLVLMNSKHLNFARLQNPLNPTQSRWYKLCGDHVETGDPLDAAIPPGNYSASTFQGGRQEILSFNTVLNDWREDTPYYLPASYGIQGANPDDAGCITVGTEAWVWSSDTNRGIAQPAQAATQIDYQAFICAYTPPSSTWPLGHYRVIGPKPPPLGGNRSWRGFHDPVLNRVVIPTGNGSMSWTIIDVADPSTYQSINMSGNHFFVTTGVAVDPVDRKVYMFDFDVQELWVADMSTLAISKVANIPSATNLSTQSAIKMCWHPDLRAVIMNLDKTFVYQVDTSTLTTFSRGDGYFDDLGILVPSSDTFFDPDTRDVFCLGCEDFNQGGGNAPGFFYWRLHFTAAASSGLPSWVPSLNTVGVVTTKGINLVDPIQDLPPPHEWDTGTGSNRAVYDNWGSGCYSPDYGTYGALVVAGGGHDGYWGNDVYLLDLNATAPAWARIIDPSHKCGNADLPNFDNVHGEFPDPTSVFSGDGNGTPGVPHIYGAAGYLSPAQGGGNKGSFIMQVATYWRGLSVTGWSHRADLETKKWYRSSSNACSTGQESTWAWDSSRNRFVGGGTGPSGPSGYLRILGSFSGGIGVHSDAFMSAGFFMGSDAVCEYGPTQDALLMLGTFPDGPKAGTYGIRAWDLAGNAYTPYDLTISGTFLPACGGPGFAWCAPLNCFFMMCPLQGQEQFLYKLTAPGGDWRTGTWTVTQITMAGVTCVGYEFNGMFKRFSYAPALKSLLWSQTYSGATYAYRLVS